MSALQTLITTHGVPRSRAILLIQELERPVTELGIPARDCTQQTWQRATLQLWGKMSLLQAEIFLAEHGYGVSS